MTEVATKLTDFRDRWDMWSLAFSPDGTHLATSTPSSDEVHVWAWQGHPRIVQTLRGMTKGGCPNGLRYTPDGQLLAAAHGKTQDNRIIRIWNTSNGSFASDIVDPHGGLSALQYGGLDFSPDGKSLMRSSKGGWYMEGANRVIVDSFCRP